MEKTIEELYPIPANFNQPFTLYDKVQAERAAYLAGYSSNQVELSSEAKAELYVKFHYQICNDCGLSESDSTENAANGCVRIAEAYLAGSAASEQRIEALEKALRELVELKDMHDEIEKTPLHLQILIKKNIDSYNKRKPLAWAEARNVLNK